MRMKALQNRCEAKEGAVRRQRKHWEYEAKQLEQYMEASCILNVELTVKIALLKRKTSCYEDLAKENTNLVMELATLHKQMEQAKADAMVRFRLSAIL